MIARFNMIVPTEGFKVKSKNWLIQWISYNIDSRYKQSVVLSKWLREQVNNPSQELKDYVSNIKTNPDNDTQMWDIFRAVKRDIKYLRDKNVWDTSEKWQTPTETITKKSGDCEDGAILQYVCARLKGIPEERLMIFCGSVKGGGHCWLAYWPNHYPLNPVFLDWCYFITTSNYDDRMKYCIQKSIIYEHKPNLVSHTKGDYYNIWFAFSENKSYKEL